MPNARTNDIGDEAEGRGGRGGLVRRAINLAQETIGRRRTGRVQSETARAIARDARRRAAASRPAAGARRAARGARRAVGRIFGR